MLFECGGMDAESPTLSKRWYNMFNIQNTIYGKCSMSVYNVGTTLSMQLIANVKSFTSFWKHYGYSNWIP